MGLEGFTLNTRMNYLQWVIGCNLYVDQGIYQTQRQIQVKLDDVYVSLQAQRDETLTEVDHRLEKEWEELEAKIANATLPAEKAEDLREQLLNRYKAISSRVIGKKYDVDEVAKWHDHLVILGDPGSGKTTLLRYLALKHAQVLYSGRFVVDNDLGSAHFPILIRIADYIDGGAWREKSLSDFLVNYFIDKCPVVGLVDLIKAELAGGNCLILLDGLDEIVKADERQDVVQRIEHFVRLHDNVPNRFVITSRIAGYCNAPLGGQFTQYTIQEMDKTRIRHFLERWCKAVEAVQTPDLSIETRNAKAQAEIEGIMRAMHASAGVRHLATYPLLLRIIALIHRAGAQLPQKRIELYKLAADTLVRVWYLSQNVPETAILEGRNLTPLLSKLAYWLHAHKPTGIATEGEVFAVLGEELAHVNGWPWDVESPAFKCEIDNFLQVVRESTGLFVERAPKRYGFIHLAFEEYYAARYLVARSKTRAKMIREHLHDPRWKEPILLALGFVGLESFEDANELLETAILAQGEEARRLHFHPSRYEDVLGLDHLFALRCLGDQFPANSKIVRKLIERLADELLHHTGPARFQRYQQELWDILIHLRDSKASFVLSFLLITALSDTSYVARHAAAESLGLLGQSSDEVIASLLNTLDKDMPFVRSAAAKSLGLLGQASDKVVDALLAALYDDDFDVRRQAIQSLGLLGQISSTVVDALLNALSSNDPWIRRSAVENLGQLRQGSNAVLKVLFNALHDDDPEVRYRAAQSLGQSGEISAEVVLVLLEALPNPRNWLIRRNSARLLGQIGQSDEPTIKALLQRLLDVDSNVCTTSAKALAQLGQRYHESAEIIGKKLVQIIRDPEFDKHDRAFNKYSIHEYAFDALWLLVVGGEIEAQF